MFKSSASAPETLNAFTGHVEFFFHQLHKTLLSSLYSNSSRSIFTRTIQDKSAAFFATGNVAISRKLLWKAGSNLKGGSQGPFDADFSEYGWEDLELGGTYKLNA